MNKRGQEVAFGLLFLVAFGLCALAFASFIAYDNSMGSSLTDTTKVIQQVDFNEQYILSTAKLGMLEAAINGINKENFRAVTLTHDIHMDGQGNFFVLLDGKNFSLDKNTEGYLLKIDGLFVLGQAEKITIKRNIPLQIQFNDKGEFIRFINK
jgi:hypothetical protein